MEKKKIPDIIIGRLPLYLRALNRMAANGSAISSSKELGEWVGISAAQIRKDISQFGEFGKQGTGYNIEFLSRKIREILNIDRIWDVAIIGMGDIGHGLTEYQGFRNRGFQVTLVFDNSLIVIFLCFFFFLVDIALTLAIFLIVFLYLNPKNPRIPNTSIINDVYPIVLKFMFSIALPIKLVVFLF